MPSRTDFQLLAETRLREAKALIDAGTGYGAGAYYIAGYAVECALKACIAKQIRAEEFPDKELANKCWTHDLETLLQLAGLKDPLKKDATPGSRLEGFWRTVKDWNEKRRYEHKTTLDAQALYDAMTDPTDGVLTWIRQHW